MKRMLINATQPEERRIAYVDEDNKLYNLIIQRVGSEDKTGNIYKGRISSIAPNLDAVFVDYGGQRHGFLPFKEIAEEYYLEPYDPSSNTPPDLNKLLKVGQEIIVRIIKDERGNKGAALSTYISLAGAYLVLMPNNPRAGISRRIEGEEREEIRERLSQLKFPDEMGVIVRTAGVERSVSELQWDLDVLQKHYQSIRDAAKDRPAPFLIHQENNPVMQAIRDNLMDIAEILIDNEEAFEKSKKYISQIRPDFENKIKLYTEKTPLFNKFEIEHQIESAYKRIVQLPSGGTIVFDQTEGGMMIDVNSAGTKDSNLERTALKTNVEAAEEIARQLRIRDIGGLIVIDFIDMTSIRNQREVESTMMNAVKADRARIHINRISRFGLLEMSRQRERKSLKEVSQHVCPTCNGHGTVRSIETISLSIMRLINEEILKPKTMQVLVQVSTEVATFMLNEKRSALFQIESDNHIRILIIPNPNFQNENYEIKRIREGDRSQSTSTPSYKAVKQEEAKTSITQPASSARTPEEPAVEPVYPTRPEDDSIHGPSGLIKRLWSSMFGVPEEEAPKQSAKKPSDRKSGARPSHGSSRNQPRQQNKPRGSGSGSRSRSSSAQSGKSRRSSSSSSTKQRQSSQRRKQSSNTTPSKSTESKQSYTSKKPEDVPAYAQSTPEIIDQPKITPKSPPMSDTPVIIRPDKQKADNQAESKKNSSTKKEDTVE